MKTHEKRIGYHDFRDIIDERLKSILIYDKNDYKVGDILKLNEHVVFQDTVNYCLVKITHIKKIDLFNLKIAYLISFSLKFLSVAPPI